MTAAFLVKKPDHTMGVDLKGNPRKGLNKRMYFGLIINSIQSM